MPDEQIIYLDPEEELTTVRERLEHTQAGRIMLVIPSQTQIHSHGWRLLHSRMRALSKEVLVISSDRQIRAVAKAAGFRVADSLESSPSGRSRPSSHPIRSDIGGRTAQRSRNQAGRGSADYRPVRQQPQSNQPRQATNDQVQRPRREAGSKTPRADETMSAPGVDAASSTYEIQDIQFDAPYEVHIDTSPSIRPLLPKREDEEPDQLAEDFRIAQRIREAAQGADAGIAPPAPEIREPPAVRPGQPLTGEMQDDPFAYMEDIQPVSLPEQRGSTYIEDIDPGVPDISDVPTDIMEAEIEDLGDEGEIVVPPPVHAWSEPVLEEPDIEETPQVYGVPPRNSRVGNMPRPPIQDIDDSEKLVPIPDQPTRVTPSTVGKRVQQPAIQPQARSVSTRAATQQTKQPTRGSRPVTAAPPARRASSASSRRRTRTIALVSSGVLVVVLAVLAFLLFGSSATVTITVPSQTLNLTNLSFEASINLHDTQHNTITPVVLAYTTSASAQSTATGTVKQGTVSATGLVNFTNKGTKGLVIPTGTVLSTSGAQAVLFVTTAEPYISTASSSNPVPPVQVQAVNPGDSGNVGANSITIIPPDSLKQIAQYNNISTSSIDLSVTNPQPTTGGGAGNVPSVTSNDVNTLAKTLHQQIQKKVNDWLAAAVHKNDVQGTLISEEKLTTTPAVGQPAPGGKFTGTLSVDVSVLVIRWADIQDAGKAQLNAAALKMKPVSVLAPQLPVNVTVTKTTPSKDGTTLAIVVSASGRIMQRVSTEDIAKMLAGKGKDQAKSEIMNGKVGIIGATVTTIDISPPLLSILPFRAEQIQVIVEPGPAKGTPNG